MKCSPWLSGPWMNDPLAALQIFFPIIFSLFPCSSHTGHLEVLKFAKLIPTSGPLHLLFPLPGVASPPLHMLIPSFDSDFCPTWLKHLPPSSSLLPWAEHLPSCKLHD